MSFTDPVHLFHLITSAAVLHSQFGCFQVVAPAASTAFGLGRRRSLHSDAKLVPTRSAAELVGAALALAASFPLASAAGLRLCKSSKENLLHLRYGAGAGE